MNAWPDRLLVLLGAVAGLLGVALSAMAAHVTGPGSLQTAAQFLLFHAPALLAVAALVQAGLLHRHAGRLGGGGIALGLGLFAGDLATRALAGVPLAPMAAPAGGIVLMGGWALLGAAAMIRTRA